MPRTPSPDSLELTNVASCFPATAVSSQRSLLVHQQDNGMAQGQTVVATAQAPLRDQQAPQDPSSHAGQYSQPLLPAQPEETQTHPRSFAERMGPMDRSILGGGTVVFVASVGFLIYLWVQGRRATRGKSTSFWNTIAYADQITQSVTITAAVMRTVMAAQLALATSMLAALYLELFGTRLRHASALSMMRAISVSPLNLLTRGRAVLTSSSGVPVLGLVVALSLVALMSQFISTVLVSDLRTTSMASPLRTEETTVARALNLLATEAAAFLMGAPAHFYRFAEYQASSPAQRTIGNTSFLDTGLTFRASLPWTGLKERLGLRWFLGSTPVWDAGVACFGPNLSSIQKTGEDMGLLLEFSLVDKHPDYAWFGSLLSEPLPFRIQCSSGVTVPPSQPLFCTITDRMRLQDLRPAGLIGILKYTQDQSHDGPQNWFLAMEQVMGSNPNRTEWSRRTEGPWTSFSASKGQGQLSLSICASNLDGETLDDVEVFGSPATSEPGFSGLKIDEQNEEGRDTTSQIRLQLGALPAGKFKSKHERGVLSFKTPSLGKHVLDKILGPFDSLVRGDVSSVHWKHDTLVREIINVTDNPALAVQALSTVLFQQQMMDLGRGHPSSPNNMSFIGSQDARIPTRQRGLIAVGILVLVHSVLVYLVLVLFLARTETTRLGQAWQAIAQLVSGRTCDALDKADRQADEAVDALLGKETARQIGVVRRRHNGRYEFGPPSGSSSSDDEFV